VVIPAYNEEARLPAYLREVLGFFERRGTPYEIIVVDDGSRDGTRDRVREFQAAHPTVRSVALPENRGKGYAVRVGMVNARGALRLFADADGATPIEELVRLEPALQAGAHIVIGSRAARDPSVSLRARRHRVCAGRIFAWLVARLGLPGVRDSQCGFKCFQAAAAEDLFRTLRTDGYGFDVELLLLARRRGYDVVEVAVNWADQPDGKVWLLTDGPRMLWEVFSARVRLSRPKLGRR